MVDGARNMGVWKETLDGGIEVGGSTLMGLPLGGGRWEEGAPYGCGRWEGAPWWVVGGGEHIHSRWEEGAPWRRWEEAPIGGGRREHIHKRWEGAPWRKARQCFAASCACRTAHPQLQSSSANPLIALPWLGVGKQARKPRSYASLTSCPPTHPSSDLKLMT